MNLPAEENVQIYQLSFHGILLLIEFCVSLSVKKLVWMRVEKRAAPLTERAAIKNPTQPVLRVSQVVMKMWDSKPKN